MSFTITVKEEIVKHISTRSEIIAELSAYIRNNGTIHKNKITLSTENKFIVDRVIDQVKELFGYIPKTDIIENLNFSKRELYQITIKEKLDLLEKELGIKDDKGKNYEVVPDYIVGSDEEVRSYLKGTFLATGTINDPQTSRYHLEILIEQPKEAVYVQKLLNQFELNAKILSREKGFMIYIKEAEKISDFLKLIGATSAVLYYENVRIYRDQKNLTNRLNNCEQANMDKVFETASEQLKQIAIIEQNDGVMLLDDRTKVALEYRKKYPEVSLKELAEIISIETGKSLTKSGLNHRMRKIKDLANRFEKRETTKES